MGISRLEDVNKGIERYLFLLLIQYFGWKKMKKRILFLTVLSFLLACFFASTAYGKTLFVDDDGPADYSDIQAAIDAANPGDIITIYSGVYSPDSTIIQIYKQVVLQGIQKGDEGLPFIEACILINSAQIINGHPVNNPGATNYSVIKNLSISSQHPTYPALQIYDSNHVIVTNCTIRSLTQDGIVITNSNSNLIQGNLISQCKKTGIYFAGNCQNNTLSENIIEHNHGWGGICLQSRSNANTIFDNLIANNSGLAGIYIYGDSNNNFLYNNKFTNNTYYNAYDQCINTWYDVSTFSGNYWDDYNGTDADADGKGDIPYKIADKDNRDPYPLGFFSGNSHEDETNNTNDNIDNNTSHNDENTRNNTTSYNDMNNKKTPDYTLAITILAIAILMFLNKKKRAN